MARPLLRGSGAHAAPSSRWHFAPTAGSLRGGRGNPSWSLRVL